MEGGWGRWGGGGGVSEENETDTFISVDIELSRVAINCSVCECAGWEGWVVVVVGLKFTFQSSSLSRIFFFSPRSSFCSGAES